MSSVAIKPDTPSKIGQGGLSSVPPSSQAILLEKLTARALTPDSEALASSDDEVESRVPESLQTAFAPPHKPVRRASWLNDTSPQIPRPRKDSFASNSMSPTTSHPGTPSADASGGLWGSNSASSAMMGRAPASSFSWSTAIWNSERKEPSRLSEVLPSPTTALPPGAPANSVFGPETGNLSQTSPVPREQGGGSQFPYSISLHPTPKTYRSQSYSTGQMDPDSIPPSMSSSTILGRARTHGHTSIQHRPSRPSMLSEMSNESGLDKVKEVEDDEEDGESASEVLYQSSIHQSAESKTIEMLARENAMLRQQQQQQQYHSARLRPRSSTAAAYGLSSGYTLRETVPEESEYAIDELDEPNDVADLINPRRTLNRRMSEFGPSAFRSPFGMDSRKHDVPVKKGLWHSQLGFGSLGDISQSRRHSFADVPTRQASIGSLGDHAAASAGLDIGAQDAQTSQDYPGSYGDTTGFPMTGAGTSSQYPGAAGPVSSGLAQSYTGQFPSPYNLQGPFGANRATSPHRTLYGMSQPRQNQLLHIVYFKCSRADVFYIQEGTGLTVKPGDLVIVEADRGTDIGTVVRDNVDWQTARELKEYYAEEHYKWLMMYSQNAAAAQENVGMGLMGASNGLQGSAVGGMGPPSHHHMQESNPGELKPKLIKRLAQSHEIHSLREKEGNEAKAKRVCMQKVKEHGLNMEILDAEFQMDWKKLTFYYFADSYINFNSLVTDLFKIYKTRIWMSAVNPASFANPTLGLQPPSGIGPGAVGVGRSLGHPERRTTQTQQETSSASQVGRGFQSTGFGQGFSGNDRAPTLASAPSYSPANFSYQQPPQQQQQYGGLGFGAASRGGAASMPYHAGAGSNADLYGSSFSQQNDFAGGMRRVAGQGPSTGPHGHGLSQLGNQQDWVSSFQGLSLTR